MKDSQETKGKQQAKAEKANVSVTVKDVIEDKAKQSAINVKNGNKNVIVKLDGKVKVRFTSDYGFMKKGKEATISDLAYDVYSKAGVVEKI